MTDKEKIEVLTDIISDVEDLLMSGECTKALDYISESMWRV